MKLLSPRITVHPTDSEMTLVRIEDIDPDALERIDVTVLIPAFPTPRSVQAIVAAACHRAQELLGDIARFADRGGAASGAAQPPANP